MQNAPARKASQAEYVGAWIGTLQGHTWFTIRLVRRGEQLIGMLQRSQDVQFDNQGEVKSVSNEKWSARLESAQINADGLLLTVKDPATQETERYLMRLTDDTTAEVDMVTTSLPSGMPKHKQWKLTKVGPNAVTPVR